MDLLNGRTPHRVESGVPKNITNAPFATSATTPDKVVNIKSDSSQIGENVSDEELLKGLLTDQLCHVCNAKLLFESQRLSHYEGKKHAQKLRIYLQSKRDEMKNEKPSGLVHCMPNDKNRFCELCSMVFSSTVVAKSHYEGKVHHKNLRKQSLSKMDSTEVTTTPKPSGDRAAEDSLSGSGDCTDLATNSNPVILDPKKFCALCVVSFNNGQTPAQHYNSRKHQRNKARKQMMEKLKELHKGDPLSCAICNLHFNSVERYTSHMQGNKHYLREKKVFEVCKSKKKSFNTFADQLANYIEVQKARGIDPKIGSIPCKDETQYEGDQVETISNLEEEQITHQHPQNMDNFSLTHEPDLPHHAPQFSLETFQPPYMGNPWFSDYWERYQTYSPYSKPSAQSTARSTKRRRKCSSSSSRSTSSFSSYTSSETSDGDEAKRKQREKRRSKKYRRERGRRSRTTNSDKTRHRQQNRARDDRPEASRKDDNEEMGGEREKKRKYHSRQRPQEKREFEGDDAKPVDLLESRQETEENVVQPDERQAEQDHFKSRKDKKKAKILDNRTEEEKLWDDSILGF
ncbi:zinc finger matrin-type protein 1 [Stigmatopora nigra]